MIRTAKITDAPAIAEIYNYYIENTVISFEEKEVTPTEIEGRISNTLKVGAWIVDEEDGKIRGYAYFTPWRTRTAYRHSAESTVYVNKDSFRKGIGRELYRVLIKIAKEQNLHRLIGGIALPNERSQGLHENMGFKKVAHFTEVGKKFGEWVDVGYWELHI